ncbi:MAG: sensor histidine kinase [Paenibacillaceae bacterium]|jgi:signal transduction histidine kinase|nr:sensor histidine kinase [Paenibacillaceae bacterium]
MIRKLRQSLYLKLFLSFLATCILFFLALAVFWSNYFSDLFYKDKKQLLVDRSSDLMQVAKSYQDGSFYSRELRISMRLISRSFNGQIWIIDQAGTIIYSTDPGSEGQALPKVLQSAFSKALSNNRDFFVEHLPGGGPPGRTDERRNSFLIYYMPLQLNGQSTVAFFHTPVEDITDVVNAVRWNIWVPLIFSLIAVGLILNIISRKLARPLQEMNRASLAVAERNFAIRVPEGSDDEIGQVAKSFNIMIEEMERWEDSRQEFLANVSHELRSPLTALRGMIMAMKDNVIPPDKHARYLDICDMEVQRLGRLVDELLDLARIQNGSDVYRFEPVPIMKKTREALELITPTIKAKGLLLEVREPDTEEERQALVRLDPDRYTQILNNLLHNAIKFTPEGKRITVNMRAAHGQFEISVADTGKGMTEEEIKRIWERFYKADPSRAGKDGGGTGLGLTIVKHLVTGMDGNIGVTSNPGEGTVFTLHFPLAGSL